MCQAGFITCVKLANIVSRWLTCVKLANMCQAGFITCVKLAKEGRSTNKTASITFRNEDSLSSGLHFAGSYKGLTSKTKVALAA